MKIADIPGGAKIILSLIGTALMAYAFASPFILKATGPDIGAGVASVAVLLTAVFHRSQQIQQVANDVPGLFNGTVDLGKAFDDLKSAIEGNTAATATNTAVSVAPPAAAPAPIPLAPVGDLLAGG